MEALEQDVFRYKKMTEREVDIIHKICSELIAEHQKETAELKDEILSLHQTTNQLQAQLSFKIKIVSTRLGLNA